MRISIFGIGYVGSVVSACLADEGHEIVAVDVAREKVDEVNAGRSTISEPKLTELIAANVAEKRLRATTDAGEAIDATELSFVCVGTPSKANGSLDLGFVERVTRDIARPLAKRGRRRHTVIVRSTLLPGTMLRQVVPLLEELSKKRAGVDLGVGYYPEFLREGSAVDDFRRPVTAVFGTLDEETADVLRLLNSRNGAAVHQVEITAAEAVKYTNNAWHALKVSFANEVGNICKAQGIDGREVMRIFCADTKLNISSAYLRPGFAFGGSCLPKDLRALRYLAGQLDLQTPLLDAIFVVNERQVDRASRAVSAAGNSDVALLGLTFKPHTDDLRESPLVELAERLLGKGYRLKIYDHDLEIARLTGANLRFATERLPHLSRLLVKDIGTALKCDTVVIGNAHPAFKGLHPKLRPEHSVIDLVGIDTELKQHHSYYGACW